MGKDERKRGGGGGKNEHVPISLVLNSFVLKWFKLYVNDIGLSAAGKGSAPSAVYILAHYTHTTTKTKQHLIIGGVLLSYLCKL